ncbi:MAG: YjbF family lipoprotein [Alphaproteobacteria bacterium]|nr:YjbF family lipoprotein [Alphaproteobacteria bacterium]
MNDPSDSLPPRVWAEAPSRSGIDNPQATKHNVPAAISRKRNLGLYVVERTFSRRAVLGSIALAALSSCGDNPLGGNVIRAIRYSAVGLPDAPITRAGIDKLPYASIAAKVGKGPRSLLILWRRENDDLHWIAADGGVLVTRSGRLVKTAGFPTNLRDTIPIGSDPVMGALHRADLARSAARIVDLDQDSLYGLRIDSEYQVVGPTKIAITGIDLETILVIERNRATSVQWSFENRFWVDADDGFVWRSVQHFTRGTPPVEIEILKPAT